MLLRVRDTGHPIALTLDKRVDNGRQAFAFNRRQTQHLHGSHVARLDDVMTIGVRPRTLARSLQPAWGLGPVAWVLARVRSTTLMPCSISFSSTRKFRQTPAM